MDIFQHNFFSRVSQAFLYFGPQHFTMGYGRLYRLGPASRAYIPLPFIHTGQGCLNQAALISGAQVMTDTAMCSSVVQVALLFYRHGKYTIQTHIALVGCQGCYPWTSYTWTNSMDESYGRSHCPHLSLAFM
jgi:hypothetical protein